MSQNKRPAPPKPVTAAAVRKKKGDKNALGAKAFYMGTAKPPAGPDFAGLAAAGDDDDGSEED